MGAPAVRSNEGATEAGSTEGLETLVVGPLLDHPPALMASISKVELSPGANGAVQERVSPETRATPRPP